MAGPIDRPGVRQPVPPPDPVTGLVECRWREPCRLRTADADGPWPSGVYLARLTASPSGRQAFIVFVVRDDERPSALLFQSSVTTFAAYNNWGGRSLYAFNSAGTAARKVSFDRPYALSPYGIRLDGAGDFLRRWEYNTLRWLEQQGYDVTYSTDVDTDLQGALLRNHSAFLSVGHDEYWNKAMRATVTAARDAASISPSWAPTRASGRSASNRARAASRTGRWWPTRTRSPPIRWPPTRARRGPAWPPAAGATRPPRDRKLP